MKKYKEQIALIYLMNMEKDKNVREEFTQWANNNEISLREIEKTQYKYGIYTFMKKNNE